MNAWDLFKQQPGSLVPEQAERPGGGSGETAVLVASHPPDVLRAALFVRYTLGLRAGATSSLRRMLSTHHLVGQVCRMLVLIDLPHFCRRTCIHSYFPAPAAIRPTPISSTPHCSYETQAVRLQGSTGAVLGRGSLDEQGGVSCACRLCGGRYHFGLLEFEEHCGASTRKPAEALILEASNCSLQQLLGLVNSPQLAAAAAAADIDLHSDRCQQCGEGGELLCCDGCTAAFHLGCASLGAVPEADWLCPLCVAEPAERSRGMSKAGAAPPLQQQQSGLSVQARSVAVPLAGEAAGGGGQVLLGSKRSRFDPRMHHVPVVPYAAAAAPQRGGEEEEVQQEAAKRQKLEVAGEWPPEQQQQQQQTPSNGHASDSQQPAVEPMHAAPTAGVSAAPPPAAVAAADLPPPPLPPPAIVAAVAASPASGAAGSGSKLRLLIRKTVLGAGGGSSSALGSIPRALQVNHQQPPPQMLDAQAQPKPQPPSPAPGQPACSLGPSQEQPQPDSEGGQRHAQGQVVTDAAAASASQRGLFMVLLLLLRRAGVAAEQLEAFLRYYARLAPQERLLAGQQLQACDAAEEARSIVAAALRTES